MIERLIPTLIVACATVSVVATAPAVSSASTAPCADADLVYAPGKGLETRVRAAVLCITNVERTARGLPAFTHDAQLETAAQWHSSDMARLRFYSHYAPTSAGHGVSFADRANRAGYTAVEGWSGPVLAENIYETPETPYKVVEGFMKSLGHCQNILNDRVNQVGVGVAWGQASNKTSKQSHPYWTQLFGNRNPESAPMWATNPGFAACPHKGMVHPAPAKETKPAEPTAGTVKAPTGSAKVAVVDGKKQVAVQGSAPGLRNVRVTEGRVNTVRVRVNVGGKRVIRTRTVFTPGRSVVVRVKPATQTYTAVVRVPPPAKGRPVIRISNTKAQVSRRIPIRTR
ncbi:MAG: CAP domain-containing protein [Solirubrobacteraceae bacterium]